MTRIDMSSNNPASLASKLQALGFSPSGAQQLAAAQMLSDARDRQRLHRMLHGLLESGAVQVVPLAGRVAMKTQSGILVDLEDDA